jgi:hypothetical protein
VSVIISRFSSSVGAQRPEHVLVVDLATRQMTSVSASTSARVSGSLSAFAADLARRAERGQRRVPQGSAHPASGREELGVGGLAPGQPPSMKPTPSSSR